MKRVLETTITVTCAMLLAGCLFTACGCSSQSGAQHGQGEEVVEIDEDATDQMYSDDVYGAELFVFQIDGNVLTVDDFYAVDGLYGIDPADDGFYKVVADVTYLNGGVAGYVDYPQINYVHSCEKASVEELGLPNVEQSPYGLSLIGDYSEGEVLCNGRSVKAVWKDGAWAWRYDTSDELEDGTVVLLRSGVSAEMAQSGIASGVLACEDYFVLPPQ